MDREKNKDEFYKGLQPLSEHSFPKYCKSCGKNFETVADFIEQTKPVPRHRSGLQESQITKQGQRIIELYRNCDCGSTLMDFFRNRRKLTKMGAWRRQLFGELLEQMCSKGWRRKNAREELFKIIDGVEIKSAREIELNIVKT